MGVRHLLASMIIAAALSATGGSQPIDEAVTRLQQRTAVLPAALRMEFRMRAAQSLAERHPELTQRLVKATVQEIEAGKDWRLGNATLQAFAVAAPAQGIAILPHLERGQAALMTAALARANRLDEATKLYRQSLSEGDLQPVTANQLLARLVKEKPSDAATLFQAMLAEAHFETLDPYDAFSFLNCAKTMAVVAPGLAAQGMERVVAAASSPEYGANAKTSLSGTFAVGAETIKTANSRDTLLVIGGARLHELAPDRFAEHKALFERWNLSGPLTVKGMSLGSPNAAPKGNVPDTSAISKQIGQIRGLPTDADRARLVLQIAGEIQALPVGDVRVRMASGLASLSTEGDLGKEALTAVAGTLAQALQDAPAADAQPYIELASLVRFEHLPQPKPNPAVDSSEALLALELQIHQEAGFTLTGLDGKTYSLAQLRGHVVLLNFWATWCPPCRKEMPDMEKLYRRFQSKGLIVLAVSDEDRETVARFEEQQKYTYPILLDPDRKVNTDFNVEGIPKSFLFDREGKLVAQAIDMRTEAQFLEMLKSAGM
jgi:peroxiredoxin